MAIDVSYIIIILILVVVGIIIWWYGKKPKIKRSSTKSFSIKTRESKKPARKPMKPFHPEYLTDFKSKGGNTTFKGNAKTPDEIKQEQREKEWRE